MTRVILCGANGKMGHVIENCSHNFEDIKIVCGVDLNTKAYSTFPIYQSIQDCKEEADVIVDFSHPSCLNDFLTYALQHNIPMVAATTGYNEEQIAFIKESAKKIPIFFTFNMSLGVNLLIDLAKKATAVLGDQFDIEIIEKHHNQKIDAPSGTAIMLANAINEVADERYQYEFDRHSKRQKRPKNEIGIHAVRGGTIVGEHEVIFAGRDEVITLSHQAMSKDIFAMGALRAAKFLKDQKPGLYSMSDLLK